jgi:lysophospholipase L1-like esterase
MNISLKDEYFKNVLFAQCLGGIMKDYKGKYFSVYGDSLSTLRGYNPVQNDVYYFGEEYERSGVKSYGDTWWGQVIEELGGKLLKNNSWSGCLVADPYNAGVESCGCCEGRLSSLGDGDIKPDVIIVFMGTNDRGWGLPIKNNETNGITCFYGAYSHMLERLKELYPSAEIWCMTFRRQEIYSSDKSNNCPDDYSQTVRDCASKYGCNLIDLFNYPPYELSDNVIHANKQGMKDIADAVLKEMNNNGRGV